MREAHFTDKFPSSSHPVYVEMRLDNGHIYYWNAFTSERAMRQHLDKLFRGEQIRYIKMRVK